MPRDDAESTRLRIAAVSDIHVGRTPRAGLRRMLAHASDEADVLLLCGDLTDHGLPAEATVLAEDLEANVDIRVLGVWGNHDFEAESIDEVADILCDAGVRLLDGDCEVIDGVGFAGVCGFAGGFDQYALHPWGETAMKEFVQYTLDETLKLERALKRLSTDKKVVLLHYAPISQTIAGEPEQIYPFLGSSRLEDPLNHYDATVAFHGHAHKGTPVGQTATGVPVYNVAMPLLASAYPEQPPVRIFELELD